MSLDSKLLAWTEPHGEGVMTCFVSAEAVHREPAQYLCKDREQGWLWVETQAAAFGAAVEWVELPKGPLGNAH